MALFSAGPRVWVEELFALFSRPGPDGPAWTLTGGYLGSWDRCRSTPRRQRLSPARRGRAPGAARRRPEVASEGYSDGWSDGSDGPESWYGDDDPWRGLTILGWLSEEVPRFFSPRNVNSLPRRSPSMGGWSKTGAAPPKRGHSTGKVARRPGSSEPNLIASHSLIVAQGLRRRVVTSGRPGPVARDLVAAVDGSRQPEVAVALSWNRCNGGAGALVAGSWGALAPGARRGERRKTCGGGFATKSRARLPESGVSSRGSW